MNFNIDIPTKSVKDRLTERQVFLLTQEQNERLMAFADKKGTTISELIRTVVNQILDKNNG